MIAENSPLTGNEEGCSPTERRSQRRYQIEIAISGVVYVGSLILSLRYVDHLDGALKVIVALLPMIGVSGFIFAIVRLALRMDEFQRQTLLVSGAIAAIVCALATMTLGFLENAGVPRISMTFVWPILAVAFGIALPFVRRHFR